MFSVDKKHPETELQKAAFCVWWSVDPNENLGGCDDALMELARFDYEFVQKYLEYFVCSADQDEVLLRTAAESLKEIWDRKGIRNDDVVAKMAAPAQNYFKALKP